MLATYRTTASLKARFLCPNPRLAQTVTMSLAPVHDVLLQADHALRWVRLKCILQVLDRYFGNVCELDLIFNFHKARCFRVLLEAPADLVPMQFAVA